MSGSVITGQALKNLTAGEHWIAGFQERRQVQRSRRAKLRQGKRRLRQAPSELPDSNPFATSEALVNGERKVGKQDQGQHGNSQKRRGKTGVFAAQPSEGAAEEDCPCELGPDYVPRNPRRYNLRNEAGRDEVVGAEDRHGNRKQERTKKDEFVESGSLPIRFLMDVPSPITKVTAPAK